MYALNIQKGTTINHPTIGKLEGRVAKKIPDDQVKMAEGLVNVITLEVEKEDGSQ